MFIHIRTVKVQFAIMFAQSGQDFAFLQYIYYEKIHSEALFSLI